MIIRVVDEVPIGLQAARRVVGRLFQTVESLARLLLGILSGFLVLGLVLCAGDPNWLWGWPGTVLFALLVVALLLGVLLAFHCACIGVLVGTLRTAEFVDYHLRRGVSAGRSLQNAEVVPAPVPRGRFDEISPAD
jgi:hypothetical protein